MKPAGTMTGRVRVKICGVTDLAGAQAAVAAGADAIGFVFAESPRQIDIGRAVSIAATIPPFVARVAVFRHPDPQDVLDVVDALQPDLVQTELDRRLVEALEGRARFLPVVHDDPHLERDVSYALASMGGSTPLLLEAAGRGGRGAAPGWGHAAALARRLPLILAGGLRPDNVSAAIVAVRPYAVDVSSGVESTPGVKNPELVGRFVAVASGRAGSWARSPAADAAPCRTRVAHDGRAAPGDFLRGYVGT